MVASSELISLWVTNNLEDAINFISDDDFISFFLDDLNTKLNESLLTGEFYEINIIESLNKIKSEYLEKIVTDNISIKKDIDNIKLAISFYVFFIDSVQDSLNFNFNNKRYNFELEYFYNKTEFIYEIDMIYHTQTPMSFTHNVA